MPSSDAQETDTAKPDPFDSPISWLLDLPTSVQTFEASMRDGLAEAEEHVLLWPIGLVLAVALDLLDDLLLLAVLPYCAYRLWKVAGCQHVLHVFRAVVACLWPSTLTLSFSKLFGRLFGPTFDQQGDFNATVSRIFLPLETYMSRTRALQRRRRSWLAEVESCAPPDVRDALTVHLRVMTDAVITAVVLPRAARLHVASTIRQAAQTEVDKCHSLLSAPSPLENLNFRLQRLQIWCQLASWLDKATLEEADKKVLVSRGTLWSLRTAFALFCLGTSVTAEGFVEGAAERLHTLMGGLEDDYQAKVSATFDAAPVQDTECLAQLAQTLMGSTHDLLVACNFQHSDTPKQLCEAYIMFDRAQRDLVKAEQALFDSILAAILARNEFKRTVAEWRSARGS